MLIFVFDTGSKLLLFSLFIFCPGPDPISGVNLCYANFWHSDWLLHIFSQSECVKRSLSTPEDPGPDQAIRNLNKVHLFTVKFLRNTEKEAVNLDEMFFGALSYLFLSAAEFRRRCLRCFVFHYVRFVQNPISRFGHFLKSLSDTTTTQSNERNAMKEMIHSIASSSLGTYSQQELLQQP